MDNNLGEKRVMNVYVIDKGSMEPIPDSATWADHKQAVRLIYLSTDADVDTLFARERPEAIYTCGNFRYNNLSRCSKAIRGKWLHVANKSDIKLQQIYSMASHFIFNDHFNHPRVSIFTSAFSSGNRIVRAYESLLAQTTDDWEWVILDDSLNQDTWDKYLVPMAAKDFRVRIYRRNCNDGFIGAMKRDAAMLCRGDYLVELDHDDEFATPTALVKITTAFDQNEHITMLGSDGSEIYENTLANHSYGEFFGRGFQGYYAQWHGGRWLNVARIACLNGYTLRHIVGVYNHVRAFRASTYRELGGHNPNLRVVDDYDLILRFFLHPSSDPQKPTLGRVPENLYSQYRTYTASNFTQRLNGLIQILTDKTAQHYEDAITNRIEQLQVIDEHRLINGERANEMPKRQCWFDWTADPTVDAVLDPNPNCVSIIMSTFNRPEMCLRAVQSVVAQTFQNWRLYIVGDQCPALDALMDREDIMHSDKIFYWNLETGGKDGAVPKNYAAKLLCTSNYIAYLDDDNTWKPNHLETVYGALRAAEADGVSFAFSSFECDGLEVICRLPLRRYRVDTSELVHTRKLFQEYGYWRTQADVGYANDWDIVERWDKNGEKGVATELATLCYNNNHQHQNMRGIYEAYDDQPRIQEEEWVRRGYPTKVVISSSPVVTETKPDIQAMQNIMRGLGNMSITSVIDMLLKSEDKEQEDEEEPVQCNARIGLYPVEDEPEDQPEYQPEDELVEEEPEDEPKHKIEDSKTQKIQPQNIQMQKFTKVIDEEPEVTVYEF